MSDILFNRTITQESVSNVIPPVGVVLAWLQQDADGIKWYAKNSSGNIVKLGEDMSRYIPKTLMPETLSGTSVTIKPGKCYEWNAEGACTLTAEDWSASGEEWTSMYVTVAAGATITGNGMTITGELTAGKKNFCQIKGFKGDVRLYVLEVY